MLDFKKTVYYSLITAILALNQSAFATTLQIPVITEGADVYNNLVIRDYCEVYIKPPPPPAGMISPGDPTGYNLPVIGQSVVFPAGNDTFVTVGGATSTQPDANFIYWTLSKVQNSDVFAIGDVKYDILTPGVTFHTQ